MPEIEGDIKHDGKKIRVMFKGEDTVLADLMKDGGPVPVQLEAPTVPAYTAQYGNPGPQKAPRFMLLLSFEQSAYGKGSTTAVFFNHRTKRISRLYLPTELKLRRLTGRQGEAMLGALATYNEENFAANWFRPSVNMGADPEIFVVNKKDEVIPAFKFLPPKAKPILHRDALCKYPSTAYWDGFQAEFTVAPNTCLGYGSDAMRTGLEAVYKALPKGARLSNQSVVQIPDEILAETSDEHVQFGCAPSLNVYGLQGGGGSLDGRATPFRFAGGHIHFGMTFATSAAITEAVKALDAILAVPCVSLFEGYDSPVRRQFYGQAGEYRTPSHGLEYRVLSNAWLIHPLLYNLVFETSRLAVGMGVCGLMSSWGIAQERTVEVIQNNDVVGARKILEENKTKFEALFRKVGIVNIASYTSWTGKTYTQCPTTEGLWWRCFMGGIDSIIKDPKDIAGNWCLDGGANPWTNHGDGRGKNWTWGREFLLKGEKV